MDLLAGLRILCLFLLTAPYLVTWLWFEVLQTWRAVHRLCACTVHVFSCSLLCWNIHSFFLALLQVSKLVVKTRSFQEACVTGVIEQLTEHLAQHSYSVSFPELAVVPLVQLRHLIKDTTVERFRRQVKLLVEQVSINPADNWEFVNLLVCLWH